MKYFEKIEAYLNENTSSLEREIFEQELVQNEQLQEELSAYEAMMAVVDFTGNNLSEAQILIPVEPVVAVAKEPSIATESAKGGVAKQLFFLTIVLIGGLAYILPNFISKDVVVSPTPATATKQLPTPASSIPFKKDVIKTPVTPINDNDNLEAFPTTIPEAVEVKKEPVEVQAVPKTVLPVQTSPVAIKQVNKETDKKAIVKIETLPPIASLLQSTKELSINSIELTTPKPIAAHSITYTESTTVYKGKESITFEPGLYVPTNTAIEISISMD